MQGQYLHVQPYTKIPGEQSYIVMESELYMSDAALNTATNACQSVILSAWAVINASTTRVIAEPIRKNYSYVNLTPPPVQDRWCSGAGLKAGRVLSIL